MDSERDHIELDSQITDDELLGMIDELYIHAKRALINEKHDLVIYALNSLIDFDVAFRKIIAYQLTGGINDEDILSEKALNFAVLMQSYYNSFRVNLLVDIVNYLNELYNHVLDMVKTNFNRSMIVYRYASDVNTYYMNELKHYLRDRPDNFDPHTIRTFEECTKALNEIRISSVGSLRKLFNAQLHAY